MAKFKNYYQVLDVDMFADAETVKSAYRRLARQYHPDVNPGDRASEERFKDINEAYEVLNDREKKLLYDQSLNLLLRKKAPGGSGDGPGGHKTYRAKEPSPKPSPKPPPAASGGDDPVRGAGATPINELFETFLKKNFAGERPPETKTDRKNEPKPDKAPEPPPRKRQAPGEEGVFRKDRMRRGEDVSVETVITPLEAEQGVVKTVNVQHNELCRRCSGTGKISGAVCPACNGEKITVRLKKIDVRIPAGVRQGSRVRVAGEGGRGFGGADSGDLFLLIKIAVDPSLRIDGLNVYCDLPLAVTDAVLGAEVSVPTLSGPVKMQVPPLTPSGKVFRLKEMGVVSGHQKGDQFVTVAIMPPEGLTPRERELYEELARLRKGRP